MLREPRPKALAISGGAGKITEKASRKRVISPPCWLMSPGPEASQMTTPGNARQTGRSEGEFGNRRVSASLGRPRCRTDLPQLGEPDAPAPG